MPKDSLHYINSIVWRATYGTLETGKINNNYPMMPIDTVNQRVKRYRTANPTHNPIMLLRAYYQSIDSNAIRDNLFTIRNKQLYDVPNRTRSPYQSHKILMAAAEIIEDTDGEVTFVFPDNLVFTEDYGFISLNGWGNATVESEGNVKTFGKFGVSMFNMPFTFRYTTKGMKEVKITFTNPGTAPIVLSFYIKVLHTNFGVSARIGGRNETDSINTATTQRYQNQPLRLFNLPPSFGIHSGCTLQIRLSQNNTLVQPAGSVRLRKPLIVVEGFDAYKRGSLLFDLPLIGNANLDRFLGLGLFGGIGTARGYDLNNNLDSANYDLIYVDYVNGTDDIVRNARMFEDVLRWVNARKEDISAGVREQNVVMGLSMGGLVARYGLAEMEKNSRAGFMNNNHETRMLITHDSPHRGANFPLAYQSMVETGRYGIWWAKLQPVWSEIADFLTAEANDQMLIYQTVPIGPLAFGNILYEKNSWIADTYSPMVNFPANSPAPYQFVALSNGSECGTRLAPPFVNLFTHEFSGFASPIPWLIKPKITVGIKMKGLPDRKSQEIFRFGANYSISLFGGLIEINMPLMSVRGSSHDDMLPIDGIAGGTKEREIPFFNNDKIDYTTPDWLWFGGFSIFSDRQENYTFVPKYSALDIDTSVPASEIVASTFHSTQVPSRSRANTFFTAPSNSSSAITAGSEFNQNHILFTNRNANFIFSQMEPTNGNGTLPVLDCFSAICNPNTITINSSLPSLCFGATTPNVFSVNNLPTPAVVTWTASNNLVIIATPNAASTVITPVSATSRGFVTITADISAPDCNTFRRNVTRRIWVGAANRLTMTSVVQGCNLVITANSPGATNFEWSLDNPGVSFGIANAPNSIAIHASEWRSLNLSQIKVTCKAGNSCNATPLEREATYSRPSFPLCPLRVIPNPKLNIFPNPTSAILNLEFENLSSKLTSLCLQNMLGIKVLCAENIQLFADNKMNLDLSTLPEGMYILQVVYENGTTQSQKVVVQRGVIAN